MLNKWRMTMPRTEEQIAARKKEYQKKNKEKLAAYAKEYREKNKEQIAIKAKEYREKNKEKLAAYVKEYREKNKEKVAAYHRKYRKKNKEKIAARSKAYQQTEARRLYITQYRKKNKEKIAAQVSGHYYKNKKHKMSIYRQRVYNITPEEYDTMLEEQNHKCKICSIKFNDNFNLETKTDYLHSPQLDHCHTTKKVRGILCPSCNIGLGHFKDSPENITNAINYLKETL